MRWMMSDVYVYVEMSREHYVVGDAARTGTFVDPVHYVVDVVDDAASTAPVHYVDRYIMRWMYWMTRRAPVQ
jgi:hypothetical protein